MNVPNDPINALLRHAIRLHEKAETHWHSNESLIRETTIWADDHNVPWEMRGSELVLDLGESLLTFDPTRDQPIQGMLKETD